MKYPINVKVTGEGYGFVYVMSYPNSDKVKIGHTLHPTTRAIDIGGTLAPEEPIIEGCYWCTERRQDVERKAHFLNSNARHNGEWFLIGIEPAMLSIETAANQVGVEIQMAYKKQLSEIETAALSELQYRNWQDKHGFVNERASPAPSSYEEREKRRRLSEQFTLQKLGVK